MNIETESYYILNESWTLDANQWSILIGGIGVFLTLIGFIIAFRLYYIQRRDNANESFEFFQSSLGLLKNAIDDTIENLGEFIAKLETDNFENPVLSVSLNDKFLDKLNLLDLSRFYKKNRKTRLEFYRQFLIDTNFFGSYHSYFTEEINYLRNNYLKKEEVYSNWQLLRSNKYFSSMSDDNEDAEYKQFYHNWVRNLHLDETVFDFNAGGKPTKVKNRKNLVENHIKPLAGEIMPFIRNSEKANEVNLIANRIIASYDDMTAIKSSVKRVFDKDIKKFKEISHNLNKIIE